MMEEYKLIIKTSERYLTAGTLSGIFVKITGSNGYATEWNKIGTRVFIGNRLSGADEIVQTIKHSGDVVGQPVMLSLKLANFGLDLWLCDIVAVTYEDKEYLFSVFDWVEKDPIHVATGGAALSHNVTNDVIRIMRKNEIETNLQKFKWKSDIEEGNIFWGFPRFMEPRTVFGLPTVLRRNYGRIKSLGVSGLNVIYNVGVNLFRKFFNQLTTFSDYKKLYKHLNLPDPPFVEEWQCDEELGRQVLNGVSPLAFERCTSLPSFCNITESHVGGLLPNTLAHEIEAGRIYISDYTYSIGIERNVNPLTGDKFVCADCIGLFYVNDESKFLPLAIQLIPNDPDSIFTPNDEMYDWLLAKLYFKSAMFGAHEWIYHFHRTHAISETVAISMFRCFPRCHPVYKLLRPHLINTPSINTDARFVILPAGSLANRAHHLSASETLRHTNKVFHLSQLNIPELLKKKGIDDSDLLPNYFYRDDANDVWNVLECYVKDIMCFYYKDNQDVEDDFELQSWSHDLAHEGFGWFDNNTRGMPDHIGTIQQLVELCTMFIFTSSAQHAAVNFGQVDTYRFVPNSPGNMRLPVHKKGEGSLQRIMDTLPDVTSASIMISFSFSLSEYAEDEVYLGQVVNNLFLEPEISKIQARFQDELKSLNEKMKERNKYLKYPYTYLMPEKIPTSIGI